MVSGPGGRYPLDVRPDQPPNRATIQTNQASVVSSCGFLSFSVRPSSLTLMARRAGMSAGSAASVTGWPVLPSRTMASCIDLTAAIRPIIASLVKHAAVSSSQAVRFHRTEHLLNDPSHAIPGHNLAGLIHSDHRVRGQQPPMDRFGAVWRIDFLDIDNPQRDGSGLVFVRRLLRPDQGRGTEARCYRGLTRGVFALRGHVDRFAGLFGQGGAICRQAAALGQDARLRGADQHMHVGGAVGHQVEDVAFAIACGCYDFRVRETATGLARGLEPAVRFLGVRRAFLWVFTSFALAVSAVLMRARFMTIQSIRPPMPPIAASTARTG